MLKRQLQKDGIKALKEKNKKRLEFLRFILSQIKNKEIEKQKELSKKVKPLTIAGATKGV